MLAIGDFNAAAASKSASGDLRPIDFLSYARDRIEKRARSCIYNVYTHEARIVSGYIYRPIVSSREISR